jgi:predicted DNA-binding protein (MmcQ/YjbR family)
MSIEADIFKRSKVDFSKLADYGFVKSGVFWTYVHTFKNNEFKAVVKIDDKGQVTGEVYDIDCDEVYFPLRVDSMAAGFAGEVRAEYQKILENMKNKCCQVNKFIGAQANRLARRIYDNYGDIPVFPWDKFNMHGVFKNPDNGKWYALIMNIDKQKLDQKLTGDIEVVNIKLQPDKIVELLKCQGFYPAYHMNQKSWITIVLDDTVPDDILFELLSESHTFAVSKRKADNYLRNRNFRPV